MNGPEVYGTIFAVGPSKRDVNVIWTGSDDGLIHVTRDAGKTWTNVTPKDMPDFGRVSQIDASSFNTGAAYVSVRRPLLNDQAPYIFKTADYESSGLYFSLEIELENASFVTIRRASRRRRRSASRGTRLGIRICRGRDAADGRNRTSRRMHFDRARDLLDGLLDWRALKPGRSAKVWAIYCAREEISAMCSNCANLRLHIVTGSLLAHGAWP